MVKFRKPNQVLDDKLFYFQYQQTGDTTVWSEFLSTMVKLVSDLFHIFLYKHLSTYAYIVLISS